MKRREEVYAKFGGRCAYCGTEITIKQMQVDHVVPLYRGSSDKNLAGVPGITDARIRGTNAMENLFPACAPCNRLKVCYTLEEFRVEVAEQAVRLRKYNCQYRHLLRFDRIVENEGPVVFWFEAVAWGAKFESLAHSAEAALTAKKEG